MAEFFRVCVVRPRVRSPEVNGHPLFVWPHQGAGRLDDPEGEHLVLYVADRAVAAVAEALGRYREWTPAVLDPPPRAPAGSRLALVRLTGSPRVCDLDDAERLVELGLRPSHVVTRDRSVTQAWAAQLRARRRGSRREFAGASWWSYYDPDWTSVGLWDRRALTVEQVEPLTLEHPAVAEAADRLMRLRSGLTRASRRATREGEPRR